MNRVGWDYWQLNVKERDMKNAKTYLFGALVIGLFGAGLLCFGCHQEPGGPTPTAKVISCTKEVVADHWPEVLPAVNTCLASGSPSACLLALVNPAVGITYDLVTCLVHHQEAEFHAAATINPGDVRSKRAAAAARKFLDEQKVSFAE